MSSIAFMNLTCRQCSMNNLFCQFENPPCRIVGGREEKREISKIAYSNNKISCCLYDLQKQQKQQKPKTIAIIALPNYSGVRGITA